ncbi:MAG: hypothetical protein LV481_03210 [Methylacidiphilales bacterium]|nr:hypothetical protein [Candidatus Methylacidiphilales bacterium]
MNPKLPSLIMTVGALVFAISLAAKMVAFLSVLGQSPIFEWGCAIVSALAFSTGMFLSLCGLIGQTGHRRQFFVLHLMGLLIFCSMLGLDFLGYVAIAKVDSVSDKSQDVLPNLIESARTADSEKAREKMAEDAYRLYGLTLAYRLDKGELAYYRPTVEDVAFRGQYEQDDAANSGLRQSLEEQLRQYPWLFSFYLGSFFNVYLVGTLWLLTRKPGPRS